MCGDDGCPRFVSFPNSTKCVVRMCVFVASSSSFLLFYALCYNSPPTFDICVCVNRPAATGAHTNTHLERPHIIPIQSSIDNEITTNKTIHFHYLWVESRDSHAPMDYFTWHLYRLPRPKKCSHLLWWFFFRHHSEQVLQFLPTPNLVLNFFQDKLSFVKIKTNFWDIQKLLSWFRPYDPFHQTTSIFKCIIARLVVVVVVAWR